jgi:hypothetical protein
VPRDLYILRMKMSERKTEEAKVSVRALWELCYFIGGDLAEALFGRLHRRIEALGEPSGGLTKIDV